MTGHQRIVDPHHCTFTKEFSFRSSVSCKCGITADKDKAGTQEYKTVLEIMHKIFSHHTLISDRLICEDITSK